MKLCRAAELCQNCRSVSLAKMAELRELSKVVALVTGGASGLGKATVSRLARYGAKVIIADLPTSQGEEVAKQNGNNTIFIPTDVRKRERK